MNRISDKHSGRYVVLFHEMPADSSRSNHWDLMLECGGELVTWALEQPPRIQQSIPATLLPTHRMDYLEYVGPVSNNRGSVSRIMSGQYVGELKWSDSKNGFQIQLNAENEIMIAWLRELDDQSWIFQIK